MLYPSPEWQEQFAIVEAKAIKREHHLTMLKRGLAGAAITSLFTGVLITEYVDDVKTNQALEANSSVGINFIGNALNKADKDNAVVGFDGFGSINADVVTNHIARHAIQPIIDGQLWSVDYNDAPLNYKDTAVDLTKTADERGVHSVTLVGYSAGGSVAMEVADEISHISSLRVNAVVLIAAPDGVDGLRAASKGEIGLIKAVKWIPGAEDSTPVRLIGELAFRHYEFTSDSNIFNDIGDFFTVKNQVQDEINNQELPTTRLMFQQELAIEDANDKDRIDDMSKIPNTRVHPTLVYIGSKYDTIVNTERSSDTLGKDASDTKTPYIDLRIGYIDHTRPDLFSAQYVKALAIAKDEIQTSINNQTSIAYRNLLNERYKYGPKLVIAPQDQTTLVVPADQ